MSIASTATDSLLIFNHDRPNRILDKKDEYYHLSYARYIITQAFNGAITKHYHDTLRNKSFYKGEQWSDKEDISTFLMDESGNLRTRLRLTMNVIRPMVEQYRGNASRMRINYRLRNISRNAITRQEQELEKMLFLSDVARASDVFGEAISNRYPVDADASKTKDMFENGYQDAYIDTMNNFLANIERVNEMAAMRKKIAFELSMGGLGVVKAFEHGGELYWEPIRSEDYFWDITAERPDHSDADYMGVRRFRTATTLFEQYPNLTETQRQQIEFTLQNLNNSQMYSYGKPWGNTIPSFEVYWRDQMSVETGWVLDENGQEKLTYINVPRGENPPKYTDKDLIPPPADNLRAQKLFKGKMKRKMVVDTVRFAEIIPSEYLGGKGFEDDYQNNSQKEFYGDILLDHGLYPWTEGDYLDFKSVEFPIKVCTWSYVNGEVLSPVDDAIDPQRFINRTLSSQEHKINKSGGSNIVYDIDTLPPGGEQEILKRVDAGDPLGLETRGQGVNNSVGAYDATPSAGVYNMYSIVEAMHGFIKQTTGLNEGLQGQSTGDDQLVGVTQLLIQRGSLMQEPFYEAITDLYKQMYNFSVKAGKKIYIENKSQFVTMVGEKGLKVIELSEDFDNEHFRAFIERVNTEDVLSQTANQQLMTFRELGMIDNKRFADLWDRSTPDQVSRAIREFASEMDEVAKMQAEQQRMESLSMAAAEQQAQLDAEVTEAENMAHQDERDDKDLASKERLKRIDATSKQFQGTL